MNSYHSNKTLGSSWEREFCERLKNDGWWIHFITPSASGSQPCDIIACKGGSPMLVDCKTSARKTFPLTRLEENQIYAFERFRATNNDNCFVAILYNNKCYLVPYMALKMAKTINLEEHNEYLY